MKKYNSYVKRITLSFFILSSFATAWGQSQHDSANYYLKLESGKVIYGNLQYVIPNIGGDYVKVNGTSYYTPDIASFNCSWGYFAKFQLDSLSNKVEIYKRTKEGKLDFYSGKSTLYKSAGGNMGPMAYDFKDDYYTKDKVHLLHANYENLSKSLTDNPVSMEFLQQYQTARNWKWGLIITGVVSGVFGIVQLNNKHYAPGAIFILLNVVIAQFAWSQDDLQDTALKNAISSYNAQ